MYRLNNEALALKIQMAAWRAFDRFGKLLNSKAQRGQIQMQIVTELQREFVNEHTCVVITGASGFSHNTTRLRFGVDEPWPAPLELEDHAR